MENKKLLLLTQTAMLAACALVLSAVEAMMPELIPIIPGAKAGFSNIAVMVSMQLLGFVPSVCICIVKAMFAGVTRGVTALVMSLCGGLLSTVIMYLLIMPKKTPFGYLGVGVAGAASHNTAQLCVAYLIAGKAVFAYLPLLLIISVVTGSITGTAMGLLVPPLQKAFFAMSKKTPDT